MSKKDFIALADFIQEWNKQARNDSDRFTPAQLNVLAAFCEATNNRFMKNRWLDYIAGKCGKNGGKIAA